MSEDKVEDKVVGIVAYLSLIGFIIALVLNNDKKGADKEFGSFHLRQSLGLIIASIGLFIAYAIISAILLAIGPFFLFIASFLYLIIVLAILALVIVGIINASNGEKKELPIIGKYASDILKNTFN